MNGRLVLKKYTRVYLKNRPLFLSLIRGKELQLYHKQFSIKSWLGLTLDFGSGDGFFLKTLLGKLPRLKHQVIGLEIDKVARQIIEQSQQYPVYHQVTTYGGQQISFENEHFDTIVSNCVLEHVTHLDENLSELARVLKPKGRFYATVMSKNWEEYLFGAIFAKDVYTDWMCRKQVHPNLLSSNEWDQHFKEAGFKIVLKTGYLDKKASQWMDILHYVSLPSLLAYKLTGKWVLWEKLFDAVPVADWLVSLTEREVSTDESAAIFYVLEKA